MLWRNWQYRTWEDPSFESVPSSRDIDTTEQRNFDEWENNRHVALMCGHHSRVGVHSQLTILPGYCLQFICWLDRLPPIVKQRESVSLADIRNSDGVFCLINKKWLREFQTNPHPPGQIDNSTLVVPGGAGDFGDNDVQLQERISDKYEDITLKAWQLLWNWYGGGPRILRHRCGGKLELRPLRLNLVYGTTAHTLKMSGNASVADLKKLLCEKINVPVDSVTLWTVAFGLKLRELRVGTLQHCGLTTNQTIQVEDVQKNDS
ncbi:hypothetical protein Pelo_10010 [Pelomyxa schiedti]|nr:hypothetical protein Pelo_10010 [Pelomyxa schiedti]